MQQAAVLDVRRFIDEQPVSRFQLWVAVLCALIVFVDGFDAQAMGYVAPALSADMGVPRAVLGTVISSGLVGMMLGALVSGPVADRIGRKPVLVASVFVFGLGALLTATADTVDALMLFRALTGLGMGGAMPNAIALTSEYMPRRRRPGAVTAMICGFSLGAAVGGLVAAAIIPRFGWESVFVVGGVVPLLIAAVAAAALPESIRFLLVTGGAEDRVRRSLSRIAPAAALPPQLSPGVDEHHGGGAFVVRELFTERRAVPTVLIWTIYFMNLLNLYFLNSWLPTVISDAGIAVETAIRLTALFQIGGIGGALVLGAILDRHLSFVVLVGCFLWAAAWIVLIGSAGASVPLLALAITCAGVGVIGGQNASHGLSSEFYPTRMRSTGVGWALGVGRVGSIVGPLVGGALLAQGTPARQVFWVAAVPALIAAASAAGVVVAARRSPR